MGISGSSTPVLPARLRAPRGHALHLWLIAGSIVLLAALVAVSITTLGDRSDRARQVQLIVADLNADARAIRGVELEVEAGRGFSPTQFEPVVVDAFTAEFTALASVRRHVVEAPCAPEPAALA
jgi:hypothetical protein